MLVRFWVKFANPEVPSQQRFRLARGTDQVWCVVRWGVAESSCPCGSCCRNWPNELKVGNVCTSFGACSSAKFVNCQAKHRVGPHVPQMDSAYFPWGRLGTQHLGVRLQPPGHGAPVGSNLEAGRDLPASHYVFPNHNA